MAGKSLVGLVRGGSYQRSWFRPDLLAGLTVAAMLVPQAMAYAELGGLPPSAGFRAALVALPLYALIGTSRHLGAGPEPGTAILAAAAAMQLTSGDPERYAALMATIAGLMGLIALVAGVFRMGFVADLLSKPVLVGYITGVGITLLTSQL
jgi:MFS superfamily sulfate permease-like transporter